MKLFFLVSYYSLIRFLPSSFVPLGGVINFLRCAAIRGIFPLGKNCKVQRNVTFGRGIQISVGDHCQINDNVKLSNVQIGSYVMIAPGVTILGRMHNFKNLAVPMIMQGEFQAEPTIIEDDVWIATNAIILPGLKISKGTIIGAGAVLTKDTEPNSIYGGVPARLIRFR